MLRGTDQLALSQRGLQFTADLEPDGFVALVVNPMRLPIGLEPRAPSMLIRLPPGFPDAAPDMFYFNPAVTRTSAGTILGTEVTWTDSHGRSWQRWSRHIGAQWRPGIDNLDSYLAYILRCLDVASGRAA
jgi:hypothetical protein